MHRLKNRSLGIALGGAALGGLVFTGATSASAATLVHRRDKRLGRDAERWRIRVRVSVRTRALYAAPAAGAWPTRA